MDIPQHVVLFPKPYVVVPDGKTKGGAADQAVVPWSRHPMVFIEGFWQGKNEGYKDGYKLGLTEGCKQGEGLAASTGRKRMRQPDDGDSEPDEKTKGEEYHSAFECLVKAKKKSPCWEPYDRDTDEMLQAKLDYLMCITKLSDAHMEVEVPIWPQKGEPAKGKPLKHMIFFKAHEALKDVVVTALKHPMKWKPEVGRQHTIYKDESKNVYRPVRFVPSNYHHDDASDSDD